MNASLAGGDRRLVWAAAAVSGLLVAQQVSGRATRDALFLTSFPVSALPAVMMSAAAVSIASVLAWSRLLRRRSPLAALRMAVVMAAVLLALEFTLALASPRLAAILFYMHMALFGPTILSGFWSVVNERFDPYSAKSAVGRIALGAAVGGIAGGLLALGVSRRLPAAFMLPVMAGLMALCALGLSRLRAPSDGATASAAEPTPPPAAATLRRLGYLRDVAAVVAIGALTESLLEYVLKVQAAQALREERALLTLFATLNTAQSVLTVVVQSLLTRRSLGVLGISGTVAVRPAVTLAVAALGVADPRLWTGVLARLAHEVGSNSLFRSGYELLYTPLAEAEKRPTKSVIDVGFDKLGALLGGAVVLATATLVPDASLRVLFALSAVLAAIALAFTGRLHRGYVASLEQSLRTGTVRLDPAEIADEATRLTLARTSLALDREALLRDIAAFRARPALAAGAARVDDPVLQAIADLRSGDPDRVAGVLRGVGPPDPALVPHLIALLEHDDLFLDVLRPLRRVAAAVAGQLVDALLDPSRPAPVRRRAARVLKGGPGPRAVDGLLAGLGDGGLDVRVECARSLLAIRIRHAELFVDPAAVFGAAERELKRAGDIASPEVLSQVFMLLSIVLDREPLRIAWWALRAGDAGLRGTALEYLDNVLPDALRALLWPRLGEGAPRRRTARPSHVLADELRGRRRGGR